MTGGQDHSGDAVRQLLAEISDELDDWALPPSTSRAKDQLVAALTAVLDMCAACEDFTAGEAALRGFTDPDAYATESTAVTTKRVRTAIAAALQEPS